MTYTVYVNENSHYMDDEDRRTVGNFEDRDAAIACSKAIVDRSLAECDAGQSAEQMFAQYTSFGEDPWISTGDPECRFSAWDYARERCRELAAKK